MSLEATEERDAEGTWEELVAAGHERLLRAVADGEAMARAGLVDRESLSGYRLHARADGTVYAQHETCGWQYVPSLDEAHDALAAVAYAAAAHECPDPDDL